MKRTILATIIAATSFGSIAAENGQPTPPADFELGQNVTSAQKAMVFNEMMQRTGSDNYAMVTPEGDVVFLDADSNVITDPEAALRTAYDASEDFRTIRENRRDDRQDGRELKRDDRQVSRSHGRIEDRNQRRDLSGLNDNEIAIIKHYAEENGHTNIKANFAELAANRAKNDDKKFYFSDEDKVTIINKHLESIGAGKLHIIDGALYKEGKNGLIEVTESEIATAKAAVVAEAQKRADEKQPPIEDAPIKDLPIVGEPIKVDPIEGEPEVKPTPQGTVLEAIANLGESGQNMTDAGIAAAQQAAVQQNQIDELYALGNQNASDIDTLFSEVDRLDTRIDQTQALNAATVNARPMVANGMTAFGAGVGYAGSEAALAIGVAHSFVDTGWSASGTLAASSDDVVVGGGVQYAF
ncbi:YadA C-terminal domain-containing protein [Vibrio sp. 1CM2L]|uniref:YadA C-terminal domain-containing protein n=1 Tax=Vibrio sp. 1CM2L TaxID=2929166 RepID=UPI0020C033F6|nr:YadA C-terminal domain-containing protein [Vibrio sp. 1CM2L]MCK8075022.1 YadA C-terminal domain-containing protein [Vibrio sp. 1CM2L]